MNNKLEIFWKKEISPGIIKVLSYNLHGRTEENHEKPQNSQYFLSVAEKIIQGISINIKDSNTNIDPKCYLYKSFQNPFHNITFKNSSTKVERIIRSLRLKNSHGYDEVSTKILKVSAPFISSPLNYILNKSIISGIFPTRLKYSIVKPLFKKGDKEDMTNYRPISLLTSFSKVFEKIIYMTDFWTT
jgi:Notch-like protein